VQQQCNNNATWKNFPTFDKIALEIIQNAPDTYYKGERNPDVFGCDLVPKHGCLQVYIARTEGSPSGMISWKFDCAAAGMKVKDISVTVHHETFHSGAVAWRLRSGQAVTEFLGGRVALRHKMEHFTHLTPSGLVATC